MQLDNETRIIVQDLMQLHDTSLNERVQESLLRALGRIFNSEFDPHVRHSNTGIETHGQEVWYYLYASEGAADRGEPSVIYSIDVKTGIYTKTGRTS